MQQIITAKLKLTTTKEQFEALRQTQLTYRDALNAVSRYAFEQGKISNVTKLHKGMSAELRTRHGLPSQLACSVERQVSATYKGLWTKLKKNVKHRRAKITKKRLSGSAPGARNASARKTAKAQSQSLPRHAKRTGSIPNGPLLS